MWLWAIKDLLLPFILLACQGAGGFLLSRGKNYLWDSSVLKQQTDPLSYKCVAKCSRIACFMALCCCCANHITSFSDVSCQKIVVIAMKSYMVPGKA